MNAFLPCKIFFDAVCTLFVTVSIAVYPRAPRWRQCLVGILWVGFALVRSFGHKKIYLEGIDLICQIFQHS